MNLDHRKCGSCRYHDLVARLCRFNAPTVLVLEGKLVTAHPTALAADRACGEYTAEATQVQAAEREILEAVAPPKASAKQGGLL